MTVNTKDKETLQAMLKMKYVACVDAIISGDFDKIVAEFCSSISSGEEQLEQDLSFYRNEAVLQSIQKNTKDVLRYSMNLSNTASNERLDSFFERNEIKEHTDAIAKILFELLSQDELDEYFRKVLV